MNSLGISEELKEKLRDVMVDRHKVALGKTLGEGEHRAHPPHTHTHPHLTHTADNGFSRGPSKVNVFLLPTTGEFGAVMEGQLNQDDSILKVAVKTMKSECVGMCMHIAAPVPNPGLSLRSGKRRVPSKEVEPVPDA